MKNLRIFSLDLDKNAFALLKGKTKITEAVVDFIKKENFDITLLQGNKKLLYNLKMQDNLGQYRIFNHMKQSMVLLRSKVPYLGCHDGKTCSVFVSQLERDPIALFNVKKSKKESLEEFKELYRLYNNTDSNEYVKSCIVSGTFHDVDIEKFCADYNLVAISSSIASSYYGKKKPIHHMLISQNLEATDVKKQIGLVDIMQISTHYPIEASISYKKVLK